jgi:hypothetical protein
MNELDVNDILEALRVQIGAMAQENAILSARLKKVENELALRDSGHSQNNR